MKLVRITTENSNGSFETLFKTDINIDEKSQVALKNISFATNPVEFSVDSINGFITFAIGGHVLLCRLTEQFYTNTNYTDLFTDIQNKLNDALTFASNKMIGLQFNVEIHQNGKFNIQYLNSPYELERIYWTAQQLSVYPSSSTHIHSNIMTPVDTDVHKYYSGIPFIKGSGVMRAELFTMTQSSLVNSGLFMGMSRQKPSSWVSAPTMTDEQKDMFIRVGDDGSYTLQYQFQYYIDGVKTEGTGGTPAVGDVLEIQRKQGRFVGGYYTSGTFTELFDIPEDNTTLYYPYMIFRSGQTDLIVDQFFVQLNPLYFHKDTALKKDKHDLRVIPIPQPQAIVNNVLHFNHRDLAEFLGYNTYTTFTINSNAPSFVADNRFNIAIFNDTFIIVLDSLELESYDGYDGVRKSILAVIPSADDNTHRVIEYEPNTLDFIDLKNRNKQNIRNIKGRILKSDLSQPSLTGLTSIALLFT
tara:strand:+ start:736 stop:2148 length:1413 start_codon:yes stop_codon:yes gene_type:complete